MMKVMYFSVLFTDMAPVKEVSHDRPSHAKLSFKLTSTDDQQGKATQPTQTQSQ